MERRASFNRTMEGTTDRADVASPLGVEFEVFLNFRGPDTRLNFADCLYHSMDGAGIRVFRDDEEIRKGEVIVGELERAIKSSTIYMPIFSRNYASSAWCLRELAFMVDCSRNRDDKAKILPIFFDVDPDDVKLKTELYHDALQKHEQNFGCDVVQQWKEALREVARIKGWNLKDRGQGELIKLIVAEVLIKLNTRDKNLPDHLVGIQDRVEDVMRLLDEGSPDVRYLVIHGMGGIGKTTLAKVIFNQISSRFQGCSFLSDVREASKGNKVVQLQKQLLSDILNFKEVEIYDSDAGMNQIKKRFRDKKVLIILDDLDKWHQLSKLAEKCDWFGLGSRIIITTRDTNFLPIEEENRENSIQTRFKDFKIYRMRELCHHYALQLFSKHAFKMNSPPHDYYHISCDIIGKVDGLPLALEIIGSSLYCKSKQLWKDMLKKIDLVPKQEVLDKLKISFEMLEDAQREIFLDIACFFIGEQRTHPLYMWKALEFFPKSDIIVLTNMSLIKVDGNDRLLMHDLLRDLGREIVRQEDFKVPGKRSRLWCPKIALDVVQTRKGTENIIALKLTGLSKEYNFTSEEFSRLPNLRLLELEGGNLTGDFKNLLSSLRWLSWRRCPSDLQAINLFLWNLVVLKLLDSDIPKNWNGWGPCLANSDLKVIHLMRCHLLTTPNFSTCLNLKILVFDVHRPKLLQIGSSIGELERLKSLAIIAARDQPPKLLGRLETWNCESLESLPESIGSLWNLTTLILDNMNITELPKSIGKLENVVLIKLNKCKRLCKLPPSMGNLRSLCHLIMEDTAVTELPETFGMLTKLVTLRMGKKPRAAETENQDLTTEEIPGSTLPSSLSNLSRLEELNARAWYMRGKVPDDFEKLVSLESLNLGYNNLTSLPKSLKGLSVLKYLLLPHCKELRSLPPLPSSLVEVNIADCVAIETVSDLSELENLQELNMANCEKVVDVPGLQCLKSLRRLYLTGCHACSSVVKTRISKVSLSNLHFLSMPGSEIPDWLNEKEVSYTERKNHTLKAVLVGVVISITSDCPESLRDHIPALVDIQATILKMNTPIFSTTLPLKAVRKLGEDQVHLCRLLDFHPLVSKLKEGYKVQVAKRNPPFIPGMQLKKCGVRLIFERDEFDGDEQLDDGYQSLSEKLARFFNHLN